MTGLVNAGRWRKSQPMKTTWNAKQWTFLVLSLLSFTAFIWIGHVYGWWQAGVVALSIGIAATLFPVIFAFLGWEALNPAGEWFDTAQQLGTQQKRVLDHYSRLKGTLCFWKSKAAAHHRLHVARVLWSLISGVSLPVLVQLFEKTNGWCVLFMTMLTTWTGVVVALAFTLRSEEKYQGFRQQESDFYDKSRELLDFVKDTDSELEAKVDEYIRVISEVRKVGRRVETSSPPSAM
jgi:hypothetical protein